MEAAVRCQEAAAEPEPNEQIQAPGQGQIQLPEGSKVPKYGVYMVFTLGIVIAASGIYSVFGYLDP